jgi:hypothetical protein
MKFFMLLSLLTSFSLSAAVVNGFVVSQANSGWAQRSTATFPEYWSLVENHYHGTYGMNIKTWMAKPGWRPYPWNISWEVRRNARLGAAQDDLQDFMRQHSKGDFRSAQRQYNRFLENMFKADVYDQMSGCYHCNGTEYFYGQQNNFYK